MQIRGILQMNRWSSLDFGQKGDVQVMHYGEEKGDYLKNYLPLYQYDSHQHSEGTIRL